ncbi:MAG TPA: peptidoglycan-binding domain-containing protein [Actinophytocola sp.]|jgi:peptidoglycan hydrolase-like protein with peptidoglycan-binding domain|nr:peptidoglycan-binding domain-containing protein [Actinophytocola sp.]
MRLQKLGICVAGAAVGVGALMAAPASADPGGATGHAVTGGDVTAQSRCLVWTETIDGKLGLTAGYFRTWTVEVDPGASGDRVREIQCLTDYYGDGPSALDGQYGPDTIAAVKRVQKQCPLPPSEQDGIVGKATWKCLRVP